MNKKFSTLVATLLVSGALFTLNAATIVTDLTTDAYKDKIEVVDATQYSPKMIKFTADVTLAPETFIKITDPGVVIDGQGHTLYGSIVITGENCTVKNLKIKFDNDFTSDLTNNYDSSMPTCRGAIVVDANKATITDNTIVSIATAPSPSDPVADGIILLPKSADASYTIEGNTIEATVVNTQGMGSVAIAVWENLELNGDKVEDDNVVELKTPVSLGVNTFINSAVDYQYVKYEGWEDGGDNGMPVKKAIVTPNEKNAKALLDIVKRSSVESAVEFKGSVADLKKALGDAVRGIDVAVACTDGNVLYGKAENPDNGKLPVIAAVVPSKSEVFGYALEEKETSEYSMLILTNQDGIPYVISADKDSKVASATEVTSSNINIYAANTAALWKMTRGKEHDGKYYYKFVNKDGVQLKSTSNAATGTDGAFFPDNNAVYNKGVVFAVNGSSLDANTPSVSFGLYKAGNNVLSVADLMWFENDGFSVTIKHQNDKGEFKKEDIAGNPFQKHLTPRYWDGSKFVPFTNATNTNKEFYLKDSEGNYIVAQKYASSGSVTSQSNYTFTTVSETALIHDILRSEGNYFGNFQAEVSAKYTDYTKLEAIDVLKVNLPAGWAEVGRLDLGTKEVPTLAASVSTELKPILVSLGSNKVVNPVDFLAKNKFYTVTKLDAKGKVLGKLAVADDLYNGDEETYKCEFVTSYGNELEGQFALTYVNGKYVFSNRETPNYKWSLTANTLYEGAEENLYVSGNTIYKIETVESHSANDGYETLSDVKNNKFHIGFSSNVFGGNAWFTENHEGTDNHTIGLNIDQEDALIFTATEYAAARKVEHDKVNSHLDTYIPTDSIYVISTLGYYSGKDYKVTYDTLKVVSYSFVNQYNEPLVYDENRYVSEVGGYKSVEEAAKVADKFALRKDNGKLNLRPVNHEYEASSYYYDWAQYQRFNRFVIENGETFNYDYLAKVYAGDATNGILDNSWMYNRTENDLFVVEPTEKPMYRPVVNPLDTISIFRNDNPKSILFEQNGFLGMENLAQYPSIAPAMVADTAYVRDNTYRPQYMLVVNPKITPAGKWCPIHGDDPTCPDAHKVNSKGWVEGRYLVNLVDTAIAWDIANKHKDNNPYINTEKYYRLGFVQAKHIEDSLIIASTNDTLMVGTEDYNQAKFAFRYVDTDAKSFRIETANYNRLPEADEAVRDGEGYVKWMNGVVVVVDDIVDGDVFNMNEDEEGLPTANEGISANGVSVATTDGAVIIKGAAGKTVAISNILGQTIANAVLSSDNETIAAPAGVVVVAVEGEAAVKAIVK